MKYNVRFTYNADLSTSLRYDLFCRRFMTLVGDSIYVTLTNDIYDDKQVFYDAIVSLMTQFSQAQPDNVEGANVLVAASTFDVVIRELNGANLYEDSITVVKDYADTDSEQIYSGTLAGVLELVKP